MEDDFTIPVSFYNKDYAFIARLRNYGYSYKIEVDIKDGTILFEPDEERNWRVMVSYEEATAGKKVDAELLKAIATALDGLFK